MGVRETGPHQFSLTATGIACEKSFHVTNLLDGWDGLEEKTTIDNSETIVTNYNKQMGFKHHFNQGKLIDNISVVVTFVFLSFPELLQFCFSSFCKGALETFATSWQSD